MSANSQLPPLKDVGWLTDAFARIDRRLAALEAKQGRTIWPHPEFWAVPAIMTIGIVTVICLTVFR